MLGAENDEKTLAKNTTKVWEFP